MRQGNVVKMLHILRKGKEINTRMIHFSKSAHYQQTGEGEGTWNKM
jgi:hypothetical protein